MRVPVRLKQKWLAIKRILKSDYFVAFTFNNKFGVTLTGHIEDGTAVHPLVEDVITAIHKADYIAGE